MVFNGNSGSLTPRDASSAYPERGCSPGRSRGGAPYGTSSVSQFSQSQSSTSGGGSDQRSWAPSSGAASGSYSGAGSNATSGAPSGSAASGNNRSATRSSQSSVTVTTPRGSRVPPGGYSELTLAWEEPASRCGSLSATRETQSEGRSSSAKRSSAARSDLRELRRMEARMLLDHGSSAAAHSSQQPSQAQTLQDFLASVEEAPPSSLCSGRGGEGSRGGGGGVSEHPSGTSPSPSMTGFSPARKSQGSLTSSQMPSRGSGSRANTPTPRGATSPCCATPPRSATSPRCSSPRFTGSSGVSACLSPRQSDSDRAHDRDYRSQDAGESRIGSHAWQGNSAHGSGSVAGSSKTFSQLVQEEVQRNRASSRASGGTGGGSAAISAGRGRALNGSGSQAAIENTRSDVPSERSMRHSHSGSQVQRSSSAVMLKPADAVMSSHSANPRNSPRSNTRELSSRRTKHQPVQSQCGGVSQASTSASSGARTSYTVDSLPLGADWTYYM